jgi:hypothetical protein
MLHREIIAVCSEIHTKHINTLCGQNVEFVNAKPGGTYSKGKGHPHMPMQAQREGQVQIQPFRNSALEEYAYSAPRLRRFTPEKDPVHTVNYRN